MYGILIQFKQTRRRIDCIELLSANSSLIGSILVPRAYPRGGL